MLCQVPPGTRFRARRFQVGTAWCAGSAPLPGVSWTQTPSAARSTRTAWSPSRQEGPPAESCLMRSRLQAAPLQRQRRCPRSHEARFISLRRQAVACRLGQEGNFVVRLADGSVRQYQRVTFDNGMRFGQSHSRSRAGCFRRSGRIDFCSLAGSPIPTGPSSRGVPTAMASLAANRRSIAASVEPCHNSRGCRSPCARLAMPSRSEREVNIPLRCWLTAPSARGDRASTESPAMACWKSENGIQPFCSDQGDRHRQCREDQHRRQLHIRVVEGWIHSRLGEQQLAAGRERCARHRGQSDDRSTHTSAGHFKCRRRRRHGWRRCGPAGGWDVARMGRRLRTRPSSEDQATNKPVTVEGIRGAIAISPNMVLMPDGSVRDFPSQPSWTTPKLTNAVAIASGGPNRFALLADGRLVAWGHKRWYPNGMVTLATLGQDTARQCAARPR